MGLSERQKAMIATYRAQNPGGDERAQERREVRAKESEARAKLREAREALQEAVAGRPGWQYDPKTGDASLSIREGGSATPRVGGIAYVRANPAGNGYESIFQGKFPELPRDPFTGNVQDPETALRRVENWIQDGIEGIIANRMIQEERQRFRDHLIKLFGENGRVMYHDYLTSRLEL
jgi:alkanesulfonate monooxygenase SsuD/methylene tetrahydromethanopterin reductase-like flavin-dependent oxidoreductase (luciferase family)